MKKFIEIARPLSSEICQTTNLNSCVVNSSDECFGVLRRTMTKQHLIVQEALYILSNRPYLCKQNSKHSLNLLGYVSCWT